MAQNTAGARESEHPAHTAQDEEQAEPGRNPPAGFMPPAPKRRKPPFWSVVKRCIQIAAAVDFLFFILFSAIGSPLLAWINVLSISIYGLAYACLMRRKNFAAVALVWVEVLGHAALGTLMVGWDSGFHYYLLMFIPAIFVSTQTSRASIAVCALWCFYVGLDLMTGFVAPLEPLQPSALGALRYFNISVVFAMFSYLAWYYTRTIVATQKRLSRLATTDPLTGLFNRRHIIEVARYEAVQQKRQGEQLAFIIADIDHFKQINDHYGHEAGDSVLVAVSQEIRTAIREQDSASRWGGEEFLVVLPDTDAGQALLAADRIKERVAAIRLPFDGAHLMVSITLGVSCHRAPENIGSAIARADRALYRGKAAGRNRVESELPQEA